MHELYAQDRAEGMTYREIAGKYGVSYQAVAQSLSRHAPSQFRPFDAEGCVYPVLRNWLNENKVSKAELLRRMGRVPCEKSSNTLRSYLRGETYPLKGYIDDLLQATGLTYEELFWRGKE
jgi:transcriptional regulator with XRE-family HTH domain